MNKIQKPFDYNDVNIFLPDNFTALNKEYWELKFNSGLPDGYTDLLEAMSRSDYTDEDVNEITEKIKQTSLEFNKQIDLEFERAKEIETFEKVENLETENKNNLIELHNNDE